MKSGKRVERNTKNFMRPIIQLQKLPFLTPSHATSNPGISLSFLAEMILDGNTNYSIYRHNKKGTNNSHPYLKYHTKPQPSKDAAQSHHDQLQAYSTIKVKHKEEPSIKTY